MKRSLQLWYWKTYVCFGALKYRFKNNIFYWVQDEEGDIGLNILNFLTLLKYKESTILLWGSMHRHSLIPAPTHVLLWSPEPETIFEAEEERNQMRQFLINIGYHPDDVLAYTERELLDAYTTEYKKH